MRKTNQIHLSLPKLQIGFAASLKKFRGVYLQNALLKTVRELDIVCLDKQLAEYVSKDDLATLAQHGTDYEQSYYFQFHLFWKRILFYWVITAY